MVQSHDEGKLVDLRGERGGRPEKARSPATGRRAALARCAPKAFMNRTSVPVKKPPVPVHLPALPPRAARLWGCGAAARLLQGRWVSPALCGPTTAVRPGQQVPFADCGQVTATLSPTGGVGPARWAGPEPLLRGARAGERGLGQGSITFIQHRAQVKPGPRAPAFAASPARTPRASPAHSLHPLPGGAEAPSAVGWSAHTTPGHGWPWIGDSSTVTMATGSRWTTRVCSRQEGKMPTSPRPQPAQESSPTTTLGQGRSAQNGHQPSEKPSLRHRRSSFPWRVPTASHRAHQSDIVPDLPQSLGLPGGCLQPGPLGAAGQDAQQWSPISAHRNPLGARAGATARGSDPVDPGVAWACGGLTAPRGSYEAVHARTERPLLRDRSMGHQLPGAPGPLQSMGSTAPRLSGCSSDPKTRTWGGSVHPKHLCGARPHGAAGSAVTPRPTCRRGTALWGGLPAPSQVRPGWASGGSP